MYKRDYKQQFEDFQQRSVGGKWMQIEEKEEQQESDKYNQVHSVRSF
jgi:hypothetical protein